MSRRLCPSKPPFGWYCTADHPAKDWRHCGLKPRWWTSMWYAITSKGLWP